MTIRCRWGLRGVSVFSIAVLTVLLQTVVAWGDQVDYYEGVQPAHDLRKQLQHLEEETHARLLDYSVARKAIIGPLHVESNSGGHYYVRDVYCQISVSTHGPTGTASGLNVEHSWPQSRFFASRDRLYMKSDLHHLFPTKPTINSERGNMKFGMVDGDGEPLSCDASRVGLGADGEPRFEPPNVHKGNVARALFYFAVRYGGQIDADEEAVLREWHRQDAVDALERKRNDAIERLQGNRNPFIDHPEYVELIQDF